MAKKVITEKKPRAIKPKMDEKQITRLTNSIADSIFGFNPANYGAQLSQADTVMVNLRWYLVSNFRQMLSQAYVEHGVMQNAVDVPVDDAFRGGIEIRSSQLDEAQIQQLNIEIEHKGDLNNYAQAKKWTRLYGGGGLVIVTNQDYKTPLNIESIKQGDPVEFKPADMWELYWASNPTSDYVSSLEKNPLDSDTDYFDYYGKQVHKSRVIKMKGIEAPSFIRPRLRGWGLSIAESMVRSINQYLKSTDLTFEVLDEFKVDIYKIKNFNQSLMTARGQEAIRQRIQLANQQKNYQNAVCLDVEDDFQSKELNFTGISETMAGIRMQIASDLRMPLTKLFGMSSAGFNSGEDDIENYNGMIEGQIRSKAKYEILQMVKIRSASLFGIIPDDLEISFKPLRVLSAEQEENVKDKKFQRLLQAYQAGVVNIKEFKDSVNRENLLPVKLDIAESDELQFQQTTKPADENPETLQNEDNFDENKHKRDPLGRFSSKEESGPSVGEKESVKETKKKTEGRIQREAKKTEAERKNLVAPEKADPSSLKSDLIKKDFFNKKSGSELSRKEIQETLSTLREERKELIKPLRAIVLKNGALQVNSRVKTVKSTYEKMKTKWSNRTLSEATDLLGMRVVVGSLDEQNKIIHEILKNSSLKPIEHDNFSLSGKNAGYRAQHLLLKTPKGAIIELQVQTKNQRLAQEYSHPIYKREKGHGFDKYSDEQIEEAANYSEAVSDYLAQLDQGQKPKNRPTPPSFLVKDNKDFDWSSIDKGNKKGALQKLGNMLLFR